MVGYGISSRKHSKLGFSILIEIFVIYVVVSVVECNSISDSSPAALHLKKLKKDLLKDYDKHTRPTVNHLAPTNVTMLLDVTHIIEMDEKLQILKVKGTLFLKWNDDHLVWKPEDYGGIKTVMFDNDFVWKPDIVLLLSARKNEVSDHYSAVSVSYLGTVRWFPPVILDAPCVPHLRHFPFDKHNCTLKFGSWTHLGDTIVLETLDLPLSSSEVIATTEWHVQNVSNRNDAISNGYFTYYMVKVEIFLQRVSTIYRFVCVVPTILTVLATLSAFWLQFEEPSRYILGCSNILMMTLLLLHLTTTIPSGNEMPIVAEYCAACLCMSFIFLLITVIVTVVSRCSRTPPSSLVRFSRNVLNQGLCLSAFVQTSASREYDSTALIGSRMDNITSFDERLMRTGDWLTVALVIDRLLFWIFSFVYLVLICVLASI